MEKRSNNRAVEPAIFLLEGRRMTLPALVNELACRLAARTAVLGVRHG